MTKRDPKRSDRLCVQWAHVGITARQRWLPRLRFPYSSLRPVEQPGAALERRELVEWLLSKMTPRQREAMRLYCDGHNFREIADLMGVTYQRVSQIIPQAILKARAAAGVNGGPITLVTPDCCPVLFLSRQERRRSRKGRDVMGERRPKLTTGEQARIKKLATEGMRNADIARAIGRSRESVIRYRRVQQSPGSSTRKPPSRGSTMAFGRGRTGFGQHDNAGTILDALGD